MAGTARYPVFLFPVFLDKAGDISYTPAAVKPQLLSIRTNGGASVALDQPGVGGITVPFNNSKLLS